MFYHANFSFEYCLLSKQEGEVEYPRRFRLFEFLSYEPHDFCAGIFPMNDDVLQRRQTVSVQRSYSPEDWSHVTT